ncbi:MAG TPA: hypothetical protein DDY76_06245 [Opitutae bacterium]|nr:hypothetical protein [Opitutae bacterium]
MLLGLESQNQGRILRTKQIIPILLENLGLLGKSLPRLRWQGLLRLVFELLWPIRRRSHEFSGLRNHFSSKKPNGGTR